MTRIWAQLFSHSAQANIDLAKKTCVKFVIQTIDTIR